MPKDDQAYYLRRAATQKMLAERADDPAIAQAHLELADLHIRRARAAADTARGNVISLFAD